MSIKHVQSSIADIKRQLANIAYVPDKAAAAKDALFATVHALDQLAEVVADIDKRTQSPRQR